MNENTNYLFDKYLYFIEHHGYIPKFFCPRNNNEVTNIHPSITTNTGLSFTKTGTVLIIERYKDN